MANHERMHTSGNVPLSSIDLFKTRRARKHFLNGHLPDENWTPLVSISRPLSSELLNHLETKQEGPLPPPKEWRPTPPTGTSERSVRRREYNARKTQA